MSVSYNQFLRNIEINVNILANLSNLTKEFYDM